MKRLTGQPGWAALSLIGAASIACIAAERGETNIRVCVEAACACLIACRFHSKFIADKVVGLMRARQSPGVDHARLCGIGITSRAASSFIVKRGN